MFKRRKHICIFSEPYHAHFMSNIRENTSLARNRFITFPINAQLIFAPIFDRVTEEGLLQVDDTDAQQFSIKVSMHHHREEAYKCSEKPLEACHIGFSQHIMLLYLMNNQCGLSVSDPKGSMDHHIEMIQKRAEYL